MSGKYLDTSMAPFFESGGTQRGKRSHRAVSTPLPNWTIQQHSARASGTSIKVRRKRNTSRGSVSEDRPCRRLCFSLSAAVCVVVISGYGGWTLSRNLSELSRGTIYSEEMRLRDEVARLEVSLERKKQMLANRRGTPHTDGGAGRDPSRADRLELEPPEPLHSHWYNNRREMDNGNRRDNHGLARQPGSTQQRSSMQREVAGEPMFGINPIRESLESRDSLVREPVPLVVGGTDGSGTRSVVALLERLRVPMVVEDGGTMDVHGSPYMVKGGWPMVVRPVLDWAHGASYDPREAPEGLRGSTIEALGKLSGQMDMSAKKLRKTDGSEAKHVTWGFKAPVSMILVPFFAEAWGKVKFLHVVRDGRDIAFSGNQTPVEKFYGETFPEGTHARKLTEGSLKAITMWDTWNVGLYEWAANRGENGVEGLDYLLLHTEDLIDPAAKFAAVKDVAEFVGSPLSDKELCCIATEVSKDMGSHTTGRKERGHITSRFGKWKGKVEGKPELSTRLHEEGGRGLKVFGYEPERSLRASDGYQCPEKHDPSCPKFSTPSGRNQMPRPIAVDRKNTKVPELVEDTDTCVGLSRHVDFKGFDLLVGNTEEHLECCQECHKAHGCTHFTFDYKNGNCYLKSGRGKEMSKEGLISGSTLAKS